MFNIIKAGLGRIFWSFCKRYSALLVFTLTETVFKCLSNNNVSSRMIPQCSWEEVLLTWLILNIKGGCGVFFNFCLKITSYACLLMSGLKLIFHCNAQSWTLSRSSFNSFTEASTLKTAENNEVSSAKSFAPDEKSSVKSLIYIENRGGIKIDPWGTPALISAHEKIDHLKLPFVFCSSESLLSNWVVYLKYHFVSFLFFFLFGWKHIYNLHSSEIHIIKKWKNIKTVLHTKINTRYNTGKVYLGNRKQFKKTYLQKHS